MNQLYIDDEVYAALINNLKEKKILCFIGGSKCGKSRTAIEIIERMGGDDDKAVILDRIPGVSIAKKYKIADLDKPLIYLKNVSGLTLLELEHICLSNYVIITCPVLSPGLLYNRFISFNDDHDNIKDFDKRLWDCIQVIVENKKLGDGNVYVVNAFLVQYSDFTINKTYICRYQENKRLFEEEFSRVSGKYLYS